ncbi:DNA methyltransferase [Arthrobacter sp. Edens01]|uniref:DNA methyltransferase n=1 Tax=Arthrobacter sp. Edens01 TaxID=1732020 RepID=UPI0006D9E89C|nr:DNA methyltransferase [Arthrobacter sp. Edens01]KPN19443.1 DNA methyltransferase [Arthrobacter sp. Edens01]
MTSDLQNPHLTYKANAGVGRHGWLRLTPAYGVRLVREKISLLPPGSIITDPFSGTGTTPLAAMELGHYGQSLDVNPFLIWMANAKMSHYSENDISNGWKYLGIIREEASKLHADMSLWQPNIFKIDRWWSAGSLQALKAIAHVIFEFLPDDRSRNLLLIGFCRALIDASNAAFNHQSMSFKENSKDITSFEIKVFEATLDIYAQEAGEILKSASQDLPGVGIAYEGDSREMENPLKPADLLVTSPPYVNRMSYIRELRPYMYWLKYLDAASDAGDLDWKAIGGTWGSATSKLNSWRPSETGTPVDASMDSVRARIAADGEKNGPLLSNYVGKYFHDMWSHFNATLQHVKHGGSVSYIIGNSTFYGHEVPAHEWYASMLSEVGYVDVEVKPIRKRNSKKALYEYDVTARRPQ